MKRIISILLAILMCLSVVSCSSNRVDDEDAYIDDELGEDIYDDYTAFDDVKETIDNIDISIGTNVDKEEHVHSYSSATCTSPKKCSCGQTSGKALGHNYSGAECTRCGSANPDYEEPSNEPAKTYGFNKTWKVDGKFEFKITSVTKHFVCYDGYDEIQANSAVIINYEVKNLGVSPKLVVDEWDFELYDQNGQKGDVIYFDHCCNHDGGEELMVLQGGTGKSSIAGAVISESNKVSIIMEIEGYTATFSGNTTEAPIEEEPKEDKLQGTTINIDNTLPETFSYYSGKTLKSSCSVTEASFEVSGDDLKIYLTGRKTYDSQGAGQSASCYISWKLYDDTNTVVDAGTVYTLSIAEGEGFLKASDTAYDCITPGKTYTIKFLNTN